jgi:hypothetical protein
VFDHGDSVRSNGNTRARHDFDALPRSESAVKTAASAQLADALESSARGSHIRGSYGKTIARRPIEGRIIAIRARFARQHAAKRVLDFNSFTPHRPPDGSCDLNHFLPRISVWQQGVHCLNPGGKLCAGTYNRGVAFGARRDHPYFNA